MVGTSAAGVYLPLQVETSPSNNMTSAATWVCPPPLIETSPSNNIRILYGLVCYRIDKNQVDVSQTKMLGPDVKSQQGISKI